tara:strand:- start:1621 stop:2592 length:972 start_codon:yes stop_codon:yes gene_type:complete
MNQFFNKKITINKLQKNKRLDLALTNLIGKYSRSQIKILLQNKNVKISNNIITDASYKVKEGEIYNISIPIIVESKYEPENIPLEVIYEDNELLVVNKSAGIVTHPAPGNLNNTLVNALLYHTKNKLSTINETNRPGIIHRLDKDTSGLLVVAKNNFSHFELANQFKEHNITRKYYAIVWGVPTNQKVEGYITRHKKNRKKMSLNKLNIGKFSETFIKIKKSFEICSLIECILNTGRTHQVRVHLTSINHPLIGDKLYGKNKVNSFGKDRKNFNRFLLLKNFQRQALHAHTLGFIHPTTKKKLIFESKMPHDMLKLLEFITKY